MKRVHRPLSLFTMPVRCDTMLYAAELLPPGLLAQCRQRLTRPLMYVGAIGTRLNEQERELGEPFATQVRQALLTVRTGVLVYFGSRLVAGTRADLEVRPPDPVVVRFNALAEEGWPAPVIADALGVSRGRANEMSRRRPRTRTKPNHYAELFESPPRVAPFERDEVMAVWHSRYPDSPPLSSRFADNVAHYCNEWNAAPDVVIDRVLWAARARRRLRQLGLEPPDVGRPARRTRKVGTVRVLPGPVGPTEAGVAQASAYRQLRKHARRAATDALSSRREPDPKPS